MPPAFPDFRRRKKNHPTARIAIAPTATPTPTPAFAPLDRPDDDDDDDGVAEGDEVGAAVAVWCLVDVLLLADVVASGAKTCAIVMGDLSQHSVLLPQHHVLEFAVPSHEVTTTNAFELPTPGFFEESQQNHSDPTRQSHFKLERERERERMYRVLRADIQAIILPVRRRALVSEIRYVLDRCAVVVGCLPLVHAQSVLQALVLGASIVSAATVWVCAVCATAHAVGAGVLVAWLVLEAGFTVSVRIVAYGGSQRRCQEEEIEIAHNV